MMGPTGIAATLAGVVLVSAACGAASSPGRGGLPVQGAETRLTTDSERRGAGIYRRENCSRCHTLFARPEDADRDGLPAPRAAGIGSRVGPDLGIEGHRRSDDWHLAHLYGPSVVVPGSPMPASRHLFRVSADGRPAAGGEAIDLVAYLQALGRARRDVWAEFRRREPEIPVPPPADAALLERGTALYRDHCVACHGAAGDGRGEASALLLFPPRDLVAGHHRFRSTPPGSAPLDSDLFRTITLGTGTGAAMPAFYWLPEHDRWALVLRVKEFSLRLAGRGLRRDAAGASGREGGGAGDPARGRGVWDRLECASCHGADAAGLDRGQAGTAWADPDGVAVPRSGDLRHACRRRGGASGAALARAVVHGVGGPMPSYADVLDGAGGIDDLVGYLRSLDEGPPPLPPGDGAGLTSPRTRSRRSPGRSREP